MSSPAAFEIKFITRSKYLESHPNKSVCDYRTDLKSRFGMIEYLFSQGDVDTVLYQEWADAVQLESATAEIFSEQDHVVYSILI